MYEEKIPFKLKMEEEEEGQESGRNFRTRIGFHNQIPSSISEENLASLEKLEGEGKNQQIIDIISERRTILENSSLKSREKLKLLENNRKAIIILRGGSIKKTENIVYSVLIFSGLLILILALLNTFSNLSTEITLTFMGTVLGGTIATITQKIGKL